MDSLSNRPDYFIDLDEPIDPNKRLGAGAYGTVYEVKLNGASCIAKRLHDILTGARGEAHVSDQEWKAIVDKFRYECSLLSRMRHPNVIHFLGIYQPTVDPRDIALIMERLYMDLEHLITHYKEVLTPTSIPATSSNDVFLPIKVHILRDISCGLLHIHSHGVVHRDLNAGNVLLTENLQAKVTDLGVARIINKSVIGKLSVAPGATDYMPPESLAVNPVYNNKLDTFSLGHLMLYLINCQYPQPQDLSLRHIAISTTKAGLLLGMQAQKRKHWIDHISEDYALCKVVVHCLQDESDDRPAMSDLKTILDGLCKQFPKSMDIVSMLMNKRRESADKIMERLKSEKERAELHHNDEITKLKATIKELEDYNKQMKMQDLQILREDIERKTNVIDCHLNVLKEKDEEIEKLKITLAELEAAKREQLGSLTDELSQKEAKIIKQRDLLEDKREGIKVMKESLAAKEQELSDIKQQLEETKTQLTQETSDLEQQLKKTIIQIQDDNAALNAKQLKIVELTEQMEIAIAEAAGYKEDFEQERKDREKIHMELTSQLTSSQSVAYELQQKVIQSIHDKECETQTLKATYHKEIEVLQNQLSMLQEHKSTQEVTSKLTEEKGKIKDLEEEKLVLTSQCSHQCEELKKKFEEKIENLEKEKLVLTSQINTYSRKCEDLKQHFEEKVETLEEEKLVLTQQVKAYSRQCEELKKTMVQLQEKSKTLEEEAYHKERLASEVDELKTQVQNAELKAQSALDSKAHLLAAFQTEQKKVAELEGKLSSQMKTMEMENLKLRNANKTIAERFKASTDQLSKLRSVLPPDYLRILDFPSTPVPVQSSSRPHSNIQMTGSNISNTYYNPRRKDAVPQTNPPQYKEELSGGYAAPQMTAAQMQQFAIHTQRQREQAALNQQEEERLRLLEQQRKREDMLADQALQELEKAEKERIKKQGIHKPNPISQATPTSSNVAGIQSQNNTVGQMVGGAPEVIDDTKKSKDVPDNELLQNIDQEIQYYANEVRDMTKHPTTAEVDADNHSSLPYDPNLVCHKCGKRYHIGEIQKFKRHIKETCLNKK